jgi:hypothetical protein
MVIVSGTVATADQKLFDICDPVILKSGRVGLVSSRVAYVKRRWPSRA